MLGHLLGWIISAGVVSAYVHHGKGVKQQRIENNKVIYPLDGDFSTWHEDESIPVINVWASLYALSGWNEKSQTYERCWRCYGEKGIPCTRRVSEYDAYAIQVKKDPATGELTQVAILDFNNGKVRLLFRQNDGSLFDETVSVTKAHSFNTEHTKHLLEKCKVRY